MKTIILFLIYSIYLPLKDFYLQIKYKLLIHIYHLVFNFILIFLGLIIDILGRIMEIIMEINRVFHIMILIINSNLLNDRFSIETLAEFYETTTYPIYLVNIILIKLSLYLESLKKGW